MDHNFYHMSHGCSDLYLGVLRSLQCSFGSFSAVFVVDQHALSCRGLAITEVSRRQRGCASSSRGVGSRDFVSNDFHVNEGSRFHRRTLHCGDVRSLLLSVVLLMEAVKLLK